MLQLALLLLGCALTRYLWEISITIASVVLGVTSFGVLFYIFILIAGAASEGCPYQTPGSQAIHYLRPKVWSMGHSAASAIISVPSATSFALGRVFRKSEVIANIIENARYHHPWWSNCPRFFRDLASEIPSAFAADIHRLGRAVIWTLRALPTGPHHLICGACRRLHGVYTYLGQRLSHQTPPEFRCISWTLQTSLDKPVHLTTLEHLMEVTELAGLDPTLVADCFSVFIGCVSSSNNKVVVLQGSERLATVSASCLFLTFHHLLVTDPTSGVLADVRRRYDRAFPLGTDFNNLPPFHPLIGVHALVNQPWTPRHIRSVDFRPSSQELVAFVHNMVKIAQMGYQRTQNRKVPRWTLYFALYSLSLNPLPPTSVIFDCLTIIAIDLGCDISSITSWDDRYLFVLYGYPQGF